MNRAQRSPLRQAMYAAWATIEACGSIGDDQMAMLRDGPDDAQIVAEYVAMLDRLERTTQDPKTRELARRVQGNVWKLAAMT
jgi:hypothetical protein